MKPGLKDGLSAASRSRMLISDGMPLLTLTKYLFLELAHQGQLETIGAVIVFQKVFFRGRVQDWNS